jgi:hypothetical protein
MKNCTTYSKPKECFNLRKKYNNYRFHANEEYTPFTNNLTNRASDFSNIEYFTLHQIPQAPNAVREMHEVIFFRSGHMRTANQDQNRNSEANQNFMKTPRRNSHTTGLPLGFPNTS